MTRRDIVLILAAGLLFGGLALWGAIYVIDTVAFSDDAREIVLQHR